LANFTPPPLNKHLQALTPYPPGKPIEEVQREFGLEEVIKLASNENPLGPSPRAMQAMIGAAGQMHLYPDGAGYYLKRKLAGRLGVEPGELILGNGSDELLMLLALAYLNKKRALLTSDYAFVRYRMAAEMAGAPVRIVPMKKMRHDAKALIDAMDETVGLAMLDVPGNPTGGGLSQREAVRLLKALPEGALLVLDQAYFEYANSMDEQNPDGIALRRTYPNLIVTRTFSKAYGLAGLRIGYAVAHPDVVRDLERIRPPFNANRMAQAAAMAALDDEAFLKRTITVNRKGLEWMAKGLTAMGLRVYPSLTNFVLVDVGQDCRAVFQRLLAEGIVARPMPGIKGGSHLRISIGTEEQNRKCIGALKKVLMEGTDTDK
jgi:histidinol-phosphate aminotransferase